jgi:ribosomal protein S6--L-glutamate ligase
VSHRKTRIVTLVSGSGWHVEDLLRASHLVAVDLLPVPFDRLATRLGPRSLHGSDLNLDAADAVLVRLMPPGSLEQVVFRMDVLQQLEARGVPVVNPPRAVEVAVDKYLASARIEAAGLLVPPSWVGERARDALAAFDSLGGDVVVKPLFGSEGRGMVRVTDRETAWRVLRAVESVGGVLYLQQFIPNEGFDLRAFVLGGQVLCAMRRQAPTGGWRANVAQGGTAERVTLTHEQEQSALAAAHAVGAVMAGVDLLTARDGTPYVLEVNAVPGWRALAAATGLDVAAHILSHLKNKGRPS